MSKNFPKVLILSRYTWDDNAGTSSTLSNIFGNYDPTNLGHIYIESKTPKTKICNSFFQISEYSLIRKIFNANTKTGREINLVESNKENISISNNEKNETKLMSHARRNRLWIYAIAREILWLFNGWKSKELINYINDSNFDAIFVNGSSLIFMNKFQYYIIKKSNKPAVFYFMDDIYTYKSLKGKGLFSYIYRFFLRSAINDVVRCCSEFFVVSPKMKKEYDSIFNFNSKILTKGIDSANSLGKKKINKPIKFVYLGQIIYGRVYSLITIAKILKKVNEKETKAQLYIYTSNFISKDLREKLEIQNTSFLMKPVPFEQVQSVIKDADVVVFVESLSKKYKSVARLSFSTKLTDYFSSGKCIFAIGAPDVAPIEYLKDNDAAIIACSEAEIEPKIKSLIANEQLIDEFASKAIFLGRENHDIFKMNNILYNTICGVVKKSTLKAEDGNTSFTNAL